MAGGERLQSLADCGQVFRGEQAGALEHLGVGDGGSDVVGDEPGIKDVILAGGEAEDPFVERIPLVPEAGHRASGRCSA